MIRELADWQSRAATLSQCGGNVKRKGTEAHAPPCWRSPLGFADFIPRSMLKKGDFRRGAEKCGRGACASETKFDRSDPGLRGGPGLPAELQGDAPAGFQSAAPSSPEDERRLSWPGRLFRRNEFRC